MAVNVTINGRAFDVLDYSVNEQATPLAADDSSGSVGTFSLEIGYPDFDIDRYDPGNPEDMAVLLSLKQAGPMYFSQKPITLQDTDRGTLNGVITGVNWATDSRTITLTGTTDLGALNAYNVQAKPRNGTLANVFTYYCSLAGVVGTVHSSLAQRQVVFPGWNGELWFHLKQMASSLDAEIAAIEGVITLRPIRENTLTPYFDTAHTVSHDSTTLAQSIEIYSYNNRWVTGQLVYPPGGWSSDVEILTVSAGEYVEQVIELSTSVSYIIQPTMVTYVPRDFQSASRYTVVGDDGFPIQPAQWAAAGGSIQVRINEDTTSLTVAMQGPTRDIIMSNGQPSQSFSLALASDSSGSRYSTLRIIGTGTQFDKQKVTIPTGVPASETGTKVGVTIDNPFLEGWADVYRTGVRAANSFNGLSSSVNVTSIRDDYVPPVEIARNLCTEPVPTPGTTSFTARSQNVSGITASLSRALSVPIVSPNYSTLLLRITGTASNDRTYCDALYHGNPSLNGFNVPPVGSILQISASVRWPWMSIYHLETGQVRLALRYLDSGGGVIQNIQWPAYEITSTGSGLRLRGHTASHPVPEGTASIQFGVRVDNIQNEQFVLDVTGFHLSTTTTDYVSGDRTEIPDAIPRWLGEPGVSESVAMSQSSGGGFGRIAGSRIVVDDRPYRVRDSSFTPDNVSVAADDDLTHGDVETVISGMEDNTYESIRLYNPGLSYRDVELKGRRYNLVSL